jgi:hypothetical protein
MMGVRSDKEGCGEVVKTRASPCGMTGAVACAGSVAPADVAGESVDERKSFIFD